MLDYFCTVFVHTVGVIRARVSGLGFQGTGSIIDANRMQLRPKPICHQPALLAAHLGALQTLITP